MDTPDQALNNAANTKSWISRMCDNFVANMYGFSASGYYTAAQHWNAIPTGDKHPGDPNAPAGALMFWGGGAGHVAISDGKGGIYTTDMPAAGEVSLQPAQSPSTVWHKPYLGWSIPYFQGQGGATGATYAGDAAQTLSIPGGTSTGLTLLTSALGIDTTDLMERGALILFGAILVIIGLWKFSGAGNKVLEVLGAPVTQGKQDKESDGEGVRKEEGRPRVLRDGEQGEGEGSSEKGTVDTKKLTPTDQARVRNMQARMRTSRREAIKKAEKV